MTPTPCKWCQAPRYLLPGGYPVCKICDLPAPVPVIPGKTGNGETLGSSGEGR